MTAEDWERLAEIAEKCSEKRYAASYDGGGSMITYIDADAFVTALKAEHFRALEQEAEAKEAEEFDACRDK